MKTDAQLFKEKVLRDGHIAIDGGEIYYVVARINTDNFNDMGDKLIAQLKCEGKYDYYIGFLSRNAEPPYTVQMLPIYGNAERYVTKWFATTPENAISSDLRDRQLCIVKRAILRSGT